VVGRPGDAWFGTGGAARARVFRSTNRGLIWQVADTPIAAGNASSGIFSLAFNGAGHGLAVGGDYRKERDTGDNIARTTDGGRTWSLAGATPLRGFRSAVAYLPDRTGGNVIAVGPAGSDRSADGGVTWSPISDTGFHAISLARGGATGWAAGEKGSISRLVATPRK